MDELLMLVKSLHEKIDAIEKEVKEIKIQQIQQNQQNQFPIIPMTSNDYTAALKCKSGIEFNTWLTHIKITAKDIETLLLRSIKDSGKQHDKNYVAILEKLDTTNSMYAFDNNKNTIYIYVNGKWTTLKKDTIKALQTKIQTKLREVFRKMTKENNALLNHESIQEMSYMEQRNKISQVSEATPTQFKNLLYKIIVASTSV
jgi:hypothetical protein